jgi:peptidoglycan hydrolase-like protein with peptidoglycan-binding domain
VVNITDNESFPPQGRSSSNNSGGGGGGGLPPEAYEKPKGPHQVLINNGAYYTNSPLVTLTLIGGSNTKRMAIAENKNFEGINYSGQIPYQTSYQWNLCPNNKDCPEKEYTVYVKFYTSWGQSSEVVSDSIIYKKQAPILQTLIITKSTSSELSIPQPPNESSAPTSASTQTPPSSGILERSTNNLSNISETVLQNLKLTRNLKYGDRNDEVRYLQIFLKSQGPDIYPEGIVSGWFGPLTQKAVERFQEKYKEDILKPLNLDRPTGIVGSRTRTKINELVGR